MPIKVCIFDDNKNILQSLQLLLQGNDEIKVTGVYENANNIEEALIVSEPDVVLMDIEMPWCQWHRSGSADKKIQCRHHCYHANYF
jgi:DNA-binding NarL/FixJ family response regulator